MKNFFRFFAVLVLACLSFAQVAHAIPPSSPPPVSASQISTAGGALSTDLAAQGRSGAAFQLLKKLNAGQDVAVVLNGDSTSVDSNATPTYYWPHKLALYLGSLRPLATVLYYQNPTSSGWGTPTVLQTGTTSQVIKFYNGGVSGTQPWYHYGSSFAAVWQTPFTTGSGAITPDLIIFNHGKNWDATPSVPVQAAMASAAVKQLTDLYPDAGVIVTRELPDPTNYTYSTMVQYAPNTAYAVGAVVQSGDRAYDVTVAGTTGVTGQNAPKGTGTYVDGATFVYKGVAQTMAFKVAGWSLAAKANGWDVADFYTFWMQNGNPNGWFQNTVHQNQIGDDYNFTIIKNLFINVVAPIPPPSTQRQTINLLTNSDFQLQTGGSSAVPDGWTATNATISQFTTSWENSGTYALKVANTTTGQSKITFTVPAATIKPYQGKYVTLLVRVWIPSTVDTSAGAIEIAASGGNARSFGMSNIGGTGGWMWFAVSAKLSATEGALPINLYGTFGGSTAAGNYAVFDRAYLYPGLQVTGGSVPGSISSTDITKAGLAQNVDFPAQYNPPLQRIANEACPTVTLSSSALSGGTTLYPYNNATSSLNSYFGYPGTPATNVIKSGLTTPLYNYVTAAIQSQNTYSHRPFMKSFAHTGKSLDAIQYGASDDVTIYVDGLFCGRYRAALATGTAQSGTTTTVTLASGSNATDSYYNGYTFRITGGTGTLNDYCTIASYVGSTKVATCESPLAVAPDSTTTYSIQDGAYPFVLDGNTGSVKYLQLRWNKVSTRTIQVVSGYWAGVVSDYNTIQPASGWGQMPLVLVGDSFMEGQERPAFLPRILENLAYNLHMTPVNLSAGSTGPVAYFSNRLNFADRIKPPAEAWYVSNLGTAGTFTLSVTYNSVTSTTSAIAYNATAATIATALEALSNMSGVSTYPSGEKWHVSGGDYGAPFVILSSKIPGATLSINTSGLTGTMAITPYLGDLKRVVPTDANGVAQPFVLLIPGTGNDTVFYNTGTYGSAVPDAISYIINAIKTDFPTAIPIMTGTVGFATVGYDNITTGSWSNETVLLNAIRAGGLPTIHGREPVITTLTAVGDPYVLNVSRDWMKSLTNPGHPNSLGSQYIAEDLLRKIRKLLWGWPIAMNDNLPWAAETYIDTYHVSYLLPRLAANDNHLALIRGAA